MLADVIKTLRGLDTIDPSSIKLSQILRWKQEVTSTEQTELGALSDWLIKNQRIPTRQEITAIMPETSKSEETLISIVELLEHVGVANLQDILSAVKMFSA